LKKYLAIAAAMIFVLGFAASAFAIHAEIPAETTSMVVKGDTQITLGGEIRFRGIIRETDFNDDTASSNGYDGRIRLNMDIAQGPASGMIQLESGSDNTHDTWGWGSHDNAATGVYGYGNAKTGGITILQAWAQYQTDVLGVKVGHMPLALGRSIFFNHTKFGDDAIVIFGSPTKGLHVGGLTIKFEDAGANNSSDQDGYVVFGVYDAGNWGASADVTLVNMNRSSSLGEPTFGGPSQLYNYAARGNAKVGPANIWGDVELQSGKFGKDGADIKIKTYAIAVGADIDLGTATIYVAGGVGSGPDFDSANPDFEQYVTSLGNHQNEPIDTFIYDYLAPGACYNPFGTGDTLTNAGICNTTFAKVGAKAKVGGVGLDGKLVWLKATEVPSGADDDIGIEVDVKASYNIAKNLKYWVETGYLAAGDFYKTGTTSGNNPAGTSPDDAWAVRHGIALTF